MSPTPRAAKIQEKRTVDGFIRANLATSGPRKPIGPSPHARSAQRPSLRLCERVDRSNRSLYGDRAPLHKGVVVRSSAPVLAAFVAVASLPILAQPPPSPPPPPCTP